MGGGDYSIGGPESEGSVCGRCATKFLFSLGRGVVGGELGGRGWAWLEELFGVVGCSCGYGDFGTLVSRSAACMGNAK